MVSILNCKTVKSVRLKISKVFRTKWSICKDTHFVRVRNRANGNKPWTSEWQCEESSEDISIRNNENVYAVFKFLLADDLSALIGSGSTINS